MKWKLSSRLLSLSASGFIVSQKFLLVKLSVWAWWSEAACLPIN
jgi:hypothetical protein